ncbi:MAG: hypothetical protein ACQEW0_09065 [Pseudomonadota bacterium]
MEKRIDGGRFSKRTRVEVTPEDLAAYARRHGTPNEKGGFTVGGWRASVSEGVASAKAYLESAGLPSVPVLFKSNHSSKWQVEPTKRDDFAGMRSLELHFKKLGHSRDSLEDLSARIICSASRLEQVPSEKSHEIVMAYTEAITLARVYGIVSRTQRNNASKTKKKLWAIELAKELAEEFDNFPDAWREVVRRGNSHEGRVIGDYDDFEITLDVDDKTLNTGDGTKGIKKEPFRTGYFSPEKSKHRKL